MLRDPLNLEILRALAARPRLPMSDLARQVGLSAPAARERVQRLQDAGVVRGYRVDLDPAALGWPITAFVRVRPMPGQLARVAELAVSVAQVVECHRITGEDCFIMKVHLRTLESLDEILDRFLALGQTTTSLVQSSPVPPRLPPLPG